MLIMASVSAQENCTQQHRIAGSCPIFERSDVISFPLPRLKGLKQPSARLADLRHRAASWPAKCVLLRRAAASIRHGLIQCA